MLNQRDLIKGFMIFKYLGKKNTMEYIKAKRTLDDQYNHKKGIIERINDKYYIDTNNDTYLRLCYYHHIDNSLYYFLKFKFYH